MIHKGYGRATVGDADSYADAVKKQPNAHATGLRIWVVALALVASSCSLPGQSSRVPAGQAAPGGDTTAAVSSAGAFSQPAANLTDEQVTMFLIGDRFFTEPWSPAGQGPDDQDGLGPTFLSPACAGCHIADGRGSPPGVPGFSPIVRFIGPDGSGGSLDGYGDQIQTRAIAGVNAEATVAVAWTVTEGTYLDGTAYQLRAPVISVVDEQFGDLRGATATGLRIGPPLIGLGLLEAIDAGDIRASADPDDADGDGISGRISTVTDLRTGGETVGRFGLKANVGSIEDQAALAYHLDLGITTPMFPGENCPTAQIACASSPSGGSPEISADRLAAVVFYLQTLAVPARTDLRHESVLAGSDLFAELGCAACHRPTWNTGEHSVEAVAHQTIYPYTDLLLHDMGDGLGDGRADGSASATEWRTPPLWGLGFTKAVNAEAGFLHDGRARTIEEAILWHGGEAQASKISFLSLDAAQREQLLHFLKSL